MSSMYLILGDQLSHESLIFEEFDPEKDHLVMIEAANECEYVWAHKLRIVSFLSAMRHFREELREKFAKVKSKNWLLYHELGIHQKDDQGDTHAEVLVKWVKEYAPEKLYVVQPGDWRIVEQLKTFARKVKLNLEILRDNHFYCGIEEFQEYAKDKKTLVMEYFYRLMRKKHQILMEKNGKPTGGDWNYDAENRESFGKKGPPAIHKAPEFKPDKITKEVMELVEKRFSKHPGKLEQFNLPMTAKDARRQLHWFITHAMEYFGPYEDAMWEGEAFLYHSRLSFPLNVKLLDPRECVQAALEVYENKQASLASVEGFIRQILGWREFIRGVYWWTMPEFQEKNVLSCKREVPSFYWDGETKMACIKSAMNNLLNHGYTHHIERLMILGNLAQLIGVHPYKFHEWHMAMYVDAVDWVSLPNTLGMSQYGDGGIVGTKPYCSTGNYVNKMSNFCKGCVYDYKQRTGEKACPFTTLYWDFLDRNEDLLQYNQRMSFAYKNLERIRENEEEFKDLKSRVKELMKEWYQE